MLVDMEPGTIVRMTRRTVVLIVGIDPKKYEPYVRTEKGTKVMYLELLKSLY
jgi:hypothetical protein